MSYLLQLADELMTAPIETIESMYNEAHRRELKGKEAEKYQRIKGVLAQVANQRWYDIEEVNGTFRLVSQLRKG